MATRYVGPVAMVLLAGLLLASSDVRAGAIVPPGFDDFNQVEPCLTDPDPTVGTVCGWLIGPVPVEFDPAAGPWVKTLFADKVSDGLYFLGETLEVAGGTAWTDWHEEIVTPDWIWDTVTSTPTASPTIGGAVVGVVSGGGSALDYFFTQPVPAGTGEMVVISKRLRWVGTGPPPGLGSAIDILQFPTVPAPPALWQLGLGVAVLALRLRTPSSARTRAS